MTVFGEVEPHYGGQAGGKIGSTEPLDGIRSGPMRTYAMPNASAKRRDNPWL